LDITKKTHKLDALDKQNIIRDYLFLDNYSAVARKYNVSPTTIEDVIRNSKQDKVSMKFTNEIKKEIVENTWFGVKLAITEIIERLENKERISKAALSQLAVLFGVLVEKGLLLQGEATSIISNINKRNPAELNKAINDLLVKRNPEFKVVESTTDKQGNVIECLPQGQKPT